MRGPTQTLWLHAQAPSKPAWGAACNGCGLCCAAEPCPLGMVLSLRRRGRCRMLQWDAAQARYGCGALGPAKSHNGPWRQALQSLRRKLVMRWIAAGAGCDSSLQPQAAPAAPTAPPGPARIRA